jgi:hypothetical protein
LTESSFELFDCSNELRTELAKRCAVCSLARENYEIDASKVAEDINPHELANPTL